MLNKRWAVVVTKTERAGRRRGRKNMVGSREEEKAARSPARGSRGRGSRGLPRPSPTTALRDNRGPGKSPKLRDRMEAGADFQGDFGEDTPSVGFSLPICSGNKRGRISLSPCGIF